ncbi:hypothetical protein DQ04_01171140 [Trypanosoma grayi]|uniref:hypothetical protein n=1 Tax=Trypanosoma grayi TaxID=71804 RepID=UPI0004F41EA9|nr:hypothetical protein DQ04_01171140 [Trypanosoma grayi]KEG13181.1 hypothetical protein DQ04_01171140 [Trypanosoma grayi]
MEEIVQLCAVCTPDDDSKGSLLGSILSFMVQRAVRVALPRMSAVEKGVLTLRLICAGGLQHDECRHFLFRELCPPYKSSVLLRCSHELYLKPTEQMVALTDNNAWEVASPRLSRRSMPLLSLLRSDRGTDRLLQPPVDFRGEDAKDFFTEMLLSWDTTGATPVSLGELPPGLATYVVLHYPARTLRLLRKVVVEPFIPSTWRALWRRLIVSETDAQDVAADTIHSVLTQVPCADFWPSLSRMVVYPLAGMMYDGGEGEKEDENQTALLEGSMVFTTHAMFSLWLNELMQGDYGDEMKFTTQNMETTDITSSSWRRALAQGLHLLEKDVAYTSDGEQHQHYQRHAGAVRAAYALLFTLYHSHSMASHYVRSALDHPEMTLFVPSFADLNEEEGGRWGGTEANCSTSAFLTALALRVPAAQLYIAERAWRLIESRVAHGSGDARSDRQLAELDARLQVLLNSFTFSSIPLETAHGGMAAAPPQEPPMREEGPRLTLRLKRTRPDEETSRSLDGAGSGVHNESKSRTRAPPTASHVAAAASRLCSALLDFAAEEVSQPLTTLHSSSPLSTFAATPDSRPSFSTTRLMLVTPSHMKALLGILSPSSSSPCSEAVHDVCCVLMSVLLYRQCAVLQRWFSHETSNDLRAAVAGRFSWRVRRWVRFFAPLGVFRYAPVAHVLLPECLRMMSGESKDRDEITREKADANGRTSTSSTSADIALAEMCDVVRAAF